MIADTLRIARGTAAACLAAVAAVGLWFPGGALGADTTIDFESLPPETTVTNQFADLGGPGEGVVFGPLPGAGGSGFRPVVKTAPAGQAQSGSQVADISDCNLGASNCGEFYPAQTTGTFQNPRRKVSVRVGLAGNGLIPNCDAADQLTCAEVTLTAYNGNGDPIGTPSTATVRRANGFRTLLSVEQSTASIRGFRIRARDDADANEQVRIDDLTFDVPTTPAPPDFTLTPEKISLDVAQGGVVRDRIAIGRSGGSSGEIDFSVSGALPAGVHATFEPNPADGGSTDLVLTADPNAVPTGFQERRLTVVGTPRSAGSGTEIRTFPVGLEVREVLEPPCVATDGSFMPVPSRVEVAEDKGELLDLLRNGFGGRIVIPAGSSFDLTGQYDVLVPAGVQIVGERGALGRLPVFSDSSREPHRLFVIGANNVCVDGIHFRGPAEFGDGGGYALGIDEGPDFAARNVLITNSEFSHWFGGGVEVLGAVGCPEPDPPSGCTYSPPNCPPPPSTVCDWMRPDDAGLVRIERNYFHHGMAMYGVAIGRSSYATIQGNVFDYIRHAVASSGWAYSGYVARFNYSLNGGYKYGGSDGYYASHYDVHGTNATEGSHYDGGWAGEYHEVAYNTIRGEQDYDGWQGLGEDTRPAFGLRGKSYELSDFHDNVVVHDDSGEAIRVKDGDGDVDSDDWSDFNLRRTGNDYDTDYSTEIAVGRFDGDHLTDVLVANGTGWFYSPGGVRPWRFLRPSDKRIRQLAFADMDGDGITDVLYREPSGRLGYVRSGRARDVSYFTTLPVPISELRSGDFDGDGLTDLFYTRDQDWHVRYGSTGAWTVTNSSSKPISGLLFGEFDHVRGTDVAGVSRDEWSYSSGSLGGWQRLGQKRADSFEGAVAADFDGNGRTDIAFGGESRWRYSADGISPMATLHKDPKIPLRPVTTGELGEDGKAGVAGFVRDWIYRWRGLGTKYASSEQNMR